MLLVLGPGGVGKSSVAMRLVGGDPLRVDARALQEALVERLSEGCWPARLTEAKGLVLDAPEHLVDRAQALTWLTELLRARAASGRRTAVVEAPDDRSVDALLQRMEPGMVVVIGLRFPKGKRGRLRYARRLCRDLGLPLAAAHGTARLEPWTYRAVESHVTAWAAEEEE